LCALAKQNVERSTATIIASMSRAGDEHDFIHLQETVGRLWGAGLKIEWEGIHRKQRRRVSLPTYPFERERFWIEPSKQSAREGARETASLHTSKNPDIADWFYVPLWKETVPPVLHQLDATSEDLRWLVFADECGIGARLTELVRESGHIVTTVAVGGEFAKQAEGVYTINPRRPADYNTLLTELKALGRVPD